VILVPIIAVEGVERNLRGQITKRTLDRSLNIPDQTGEHDTVAGTIRIDLKTRLIDSYINEITLTWDKLAKYGRAGETRRIQLNRRGIGGQRISRDLWLRVKTHEPIQSNAPKGRSRIKKAGGWDYVMGR
jgi:hypothetical protein